jgi:membrane-bound lytic murein transglycosylase F
LLNGYGKKLEALGIFLTIMVGLCCMNGCENPPSSGSLKNIRRVGEITVLTRNNANCYYLYRDQAMGFEYDLAKAFADYLGVSLNIKIASRWDKMIPQLLNGEGAFVAANMTHTPSRAKKVVFSDSYLFIHQHILVHRHNRHIQTPEDLAGEVVHVRRGTSYQEQLEKLKNNGIDLEIKLHDDVPTEELIRQVARKKIRITIADTHIARLNRRYYPEIIIAGVISDKESLAWAVHPKAKKLQKEINRFFKKIKKDGTFQEIYTTYFSEIEKFDFVDLRKFHRRLKSHLPRYLDTIKNAAKQHGFDWRLIASQIYQESHLNPYAVSPAGAKGLMQLIKPTALSLGVKNRFNPSQNIHGGVRYLKQLYDFFDNASDTDRLYLALAAYNIGKAHVLDARKLARDMKLDPNKWRSLKETLPLLRFPKYHQAATYGYCRGTEPVRYVKRIRVYYDILKREGIEYTQESGEKQVKDEI